MKPVYFQILDHQWSPPLALWPEELEDLLDLMTDEELEDFVRVFLAGPENIKAQEHKSA